MHIRRCVKRTIFFANIGIKGVPTTVYAKNANEDKFFPIMILKKGRMNLISRPWSVLCHCEYVVVACMFTSANFDVLKN